MTHFSYISLSSKLKSRSGFLPQRVWTSIKQNSKHILAHLLLISYHLPVEGDEVVAVYSPPEPLSR